MNLALPQRLLWGSTGAKDSAAPNGLYAEALLAQLAAAGVDDDTLAADLQREGTAVFGKSWKELMLRIASKRGLP
jgi:transaldolase